VVERGGRHPRNHRWSEGAPAGSGHVALIDQFVDAGVKLWAVGDDDQTLYAFRASRYMLEFTKKYPDAKVHLLDRNYRSAPDIVLAAKRLIRGNRRRVDKDYQPTSVEPGELVIRATPCRR
jgi:DNA helicase-2/ATP-dependent DNA helicase PcrA